MRPVQQPETTDEPEQPAAEHAKRQRPRMNLCVTVRADAAPPGESDGAAMDTKAAPDAGRAVLDWLAESADNRALFALNHARALRRAAGDCLPEDDAVAIERVNIRHARANAQQLHDIELCSLDIRTPEEGR